jgi:glycosyltransferase involved in cell wall biosynthesis
MTRASSAGGPVTFSVIVPTCGRESILGALASITEQLEPGDEVLVRCSRDGDYGNAARQSMIECARGTHLVFMDDDDQFARGALATMRRFAREHPARIGVFRMQYLDGAVIWTDRQLRDGNVSSQVLCVPNVPERLGRWESPGYPLIGDYEFLRSTVELQGEPIFRDEIVAYIRSDRRRAIRSAQRLRARLGVLRFRAAPRTRVLRALGRLS